MILIINTTADTSITSDLREALAGKGATDFEIVEAAGMKISHCVGCNFCWLKTPGICSIKDDYEEILKKMITADQLWVISGTSLGFLDHKGKNIFDRIMPLVTMYLKFKGNQMRHVMRYKKNADVGLIYEGEADRAYLERWNERAALNIGTKSLGVFPAEEWKEAVLCMH
ncbi:MAG: flavodoxin family protein [Clostridiales bacterium]|nr:flavodoxin family protein [Clostridiales bacterium]